LLREITEGLRYLARDPYLRVLTAFGAASNLALIGYQALLVVFLVRELGLGPTGVGLVLSGAAVGGVFGAAAVGPVVRRFGTARGLLACQFGAAPFALLIPLATPGAGALLVVLGGLGVGVGVVAGNVIKTAFRQTYVPRALLGRVAVSMQIFNYGTIPLGALGAGALGTALGVRPALWIATSGLLAATCLLLIGPLRRHRDLPSAPLVEHRASSSGRADEQGVGGQPLSGNSGERG
jgi:MFS family permease